MQAATSRSRARQVERRGFISRARVWRRQRCIPSQSEHVYGRLYATTVDDIVSWVWHWQEQKKVACCASDLIAF
jgi:hypothetical protein